MWPASWSGSLAGRIIREIRARIDDPPIEITISILSGYAAYLPAEELGASGVIAAVTTGLYMGWHTPQLTTPLMRLQGVAVWEILTFLLNAILFLLVGLQLPGIIDELSGEASSDLVLWAVLVSAVVILVRMLWMFTVPYVLRMLDRREVQRRRRSPPSERVIVGWAGMRGSVSLAAALAVPLTVDAGGPFPERDLIIFLAFAVILATLVGQGLTLGPLIERLGVTDDGVDEQRGARCAAAPRRGGHRENRGARRARLDQPRECRARSRPARLPAPALGRARRR